MSNLGLQIRLRSISDNIGKDCEVQEKADQRIRRDDSQGYARESQDRIDYNQEQHPEEGGHTALFASQSLYFGFAINVALLIAVIYQPNG